MAASRSVVTESRGDMRCRSVVTEQKRAQHGVHLVSVEESGSESGSDRCPREERHHRTTKPAHVSDQHEAKKDKKKNEKKEEKKEDTKKQQRASPDKKEEKKGGAKDLKDQLDAGKEKGLSKEKSNLDKKAKKAK